MTALTGGSVSVNPAVQSTVYARTWGGNHL